MLVLFFILGYLLTGITTTLYVVSKINDRVIVFSMIVLKLIITFLESKYQILGPNANVEFFYWLEIWEDLKDDNNGLIYSEDFLFYYNLYPAFLVDIFNETSTLLVRIVNASISILFLLPTFSILKITIPNRVINYVPLIICILFWPSILRTTIDCGRTSLSVFFTLCSLYATVRLNKKISITTILLLTLFSLLTYKLRKWYIFFPMTLIVVFGLEKIRSIDSIFRKLLLFFIFFLVFLTISNIFQMLNLIGSTDLMSFVISYTNDVLKESDQVDGGSSYLVNFYPQNFLSLFLYIPIQGFFFLYSPFLWQVSSFKILVSSIFSFITLVGTFKILFRKGQINSKLVLLSVIFTGLILGVGVKNAGSAERWRIPITIITITYFFTKTSKVENISNYN